jgi:hypothetical protein
MSSSFKHKRDCVNYVIYEDGYRKPSIDGLPLTEMVLCTHKY